MAFGACAFEIWSCCHASWIAALGAIICLYEIVSQNSGPYISSNSSVVVNLCSFGDLELTTPLDMFFPRVICLAHRG